MLKTVFCPKLMFGIHLMFFASESLDNWARGIIGIMLHAWTTHPLPHHQIFRSNKRKNPHRRWISRYQRRLRAQPVCFYQLEQSAMELNIFLLLNQPISHSCMFPSTQVSTPAIPPLHLQVSISFHVRTQVSSSFGRCIP